MEEYGAWPGELEIRRVLTFVGNDTVTTQMTAVWYATSIEAPTTAYIGISVDGPSPTDGISLYENVLPGDVPATPGGPATLGGKDQVFSMDADGQIAMAAKEIGVYEVAIYSLEGS